MTELSTAPTTGPANSSPEGNAPSQDAGLTPAAPATASASTVLAQLESSGWMILHSLSTTTKNSVVIDHLAIGPGGIFVVDAHSWTPACPPLSDRIRRRSSMPASPREPGPIAAPAALPPVCGSASDLRRCEPDVDAARLIAHLHDLNAFRRHHLSTTSPGRRRDR